MSRQSTAAQRNLTLTEELEKLEQSITLTLQEIDHNFSRAHRIVTTSILPIVEQYAEHSKDVWEGSKFWKQFFEASANVSLSGYEEPPPEDETVTEEEATNATTPSQSTYDSPAPVDQNMNPNDHNFPDLDDSLSPSPSHSTPRPPPKAKASQVKPSKAPYSSPYETLKRETFGSINRQDSPSESTLPSTPGAHTSQKPNSSPFAPPSTSAHPAHRTPSNDILLHRVLDKNWRIQATPHSTARHLPYRSKTEKMDQTPMPNTIGKAQKGRSNVADDLDSSPVIAVPELHAEIFDTPARKGRVPGVSVLTPARGRKGSATAEKAERGTARDRANLWDSDEEDDDGDGGMGISPPKTMQFHVPQGRFVRTPAREASKRIVEDLLLTAGGNVTDDLDEDSPSVVKRGALIEEDTF